MGTTRCILEGLKDKVVYNFRSFECNPEMFILATKNNKQNLNSNFDIIFGKLVDESLLSSWFDVSILSSDQKSWLQQDYNWMKDLPNVYYKVHDKIDFLVLDGGEFSTYMEWNLLKDRSRYCALDDTKELKCRKIREEVLNHPLIYRIIDDNLNERNGYLVYEKIN